MLSKSFFQFGQLHIGAYEKLKILFY